MISYSDYLEPLKSGLNQQENSMTDDTAFTLPTSSSQPARMVTGQPHPIALKADTMSDAIDAQKERQEELKRALDKLIEDAVSLRALM